MPVVVSVASMRMSDEYACMFVTSSKELMKRAGEAIYKSVLWREPVGIVCGKGNNAGDGYVVAGLMKDAGVDVELILLEDRFSEDGRYYYDICMEKGVKVRMFDETTDLHKYHSILDCLLGTGFSGEVEGKMADLITAVNESGAYVVSADINSGLNGDTGEGRLYVHSDLTVSIGTFKYGHFKGQASFAMKEKVNCDIGIPIIGPSGFIPSHHIVMPEINADEALERLKSGNRKYVKSNIYEGNVSLELRKKASIVGQKPVAIIICCSDSRVIPEAIFASGLGDLFVIRIAGNVIDDHQLGSIEYAAAHLGTSLIVVLGHTKCGAVDAAMNHDPEGYIKYITDQIKVAIGNERDERKACCLNVEQGVRMIEESLEIQEIEHEDGLKVVGALYDIETGEVEFLDTKKKPEMEFRPVNIPFMNMMNMG